MVLLMVLFLAKQIITLYNAVQKALTKDQHALVKKCRDEEKIKSDLVSKIHCLKLFSRRQSPEQQADINALKEQGLVDDIKQKFPQLVFRRFALHEVRNLFVELNRADFGEWFLHERLDHIILYTTYGSVFPALRFVKTGEGTFKCSGFCFDIRFGA
ncbi:hypothetical protein VCRA2133E348_340004 [Vibrio crassostreae]|nr:hypothetical protein BTO12_19320 [Vibrio splendidus]CAK2888645.1 hypothetical protein VCRA2133E348_340004 [Vibrio crassostreae]